MANGNGQDYGFFGDTMYDYSGDTDPQSTSDPFSAGPETDLTGPGGDDSSYYASDIGDAVLPGANTVPFIGPMADLAKTALGIRTPGGYWGGFEYTPEQPLPNLGTQPQLPAGPGGGYSIMPVPSSSGRCAPKMAVQVMVTPKRAAWIMVEQKVYASTGRSPSHPQMRQLITRFGLAGAQGMGLSPQEALFVVANSHGHRHRGPHLFTLVRQVRKAHHAMKTLSKWAHKAHLGRSSSRSCAPRHRKHKKH